MTEPDDNQAMDSTDSRAETDRNELRPASSDRSPMLYDDLVAPEPIPTTPPAQARWLAFGSILLGGLLGGLIGYGTGDLMTESPLWAALGGLIGALLCAVGVGVVAGLALRAMNEWKPVKHPESETRAASGLVMRDSGDEPDSTSRSQAGN